MSADSAAQQKPLMRVKEVATLFDVDPETVRVWARTGKLRSRRTPGGRVLIFRRADVYALLNDPDNENGPALVIRAPGEPSIPAPAS